MAKKRIGILTGGGDVPGLNSVIKTVTYRSSENGIEVVGLRRGWEALTHLDLEDPNSRRRYVMALDRENTRTIDRRGGTVLHSSRTNPAKMTKLPDHLAGKDFPLSVSSKGIATNTWDVSKQVLANLSALGIEHLIAIGGDDTLGYAAKLNELGVKIIAIPKTMDNDVHNTEYCIGFSTAITSASGPRWPRMSGSAFSASSAAMPALLRSTRHTPPRSAASSPNTRSTSTSSSGCSSKRSAQIRATMRWLCSARVPSGRGYQIREYGEPDAYGHRKKASVAESLADEIKRRTGEETMTSDLTYDLRSGDPDFVDKLVGLTFGNMAYDAMLEGQTGLMSALVKGCYELVPIPDPKLGPRKLDVATMYNTERYRPMYANKRGLPVFLQRVS